MRDIKKVADRLIRKYNTRNPFELASCINVKILYEDLGHVNGFYQSCPKNKIIHINKNLDSDLKRIVCAHELGHALLHSKLNILFLEKNTFCVKNKYEREANKFAAEVLIEDNIMHEYKDFTIEQISLSENMNIELLKLKFN